MQLIADAIGVELDEIKCVAEYAQTTEDLPIASWTIKAGHVAGVSASWQGIVNGKTLIDLNVRSPSPEDRACVILTPLARHAFQ